MAKPDEMRELLKKGIKTDKKALAMLKKLKMRAKETIEKELAFFQGENNFIISYVNVNGLSKKHYKNLTQDINVLASNVIGIGETGLEPYTSTTGYKLFPPHQGKFF